MCSNTTDTFCPIFGDAVTLRSDAKYKKTYYDIPENVIFYSFTSAYDRLVNCQKCYVHNNCVVYLRTKIYSYELKFPKIRALAQQSSHTEEETNDQPSSESHCT